MTTPKPERQGPSCVFVLCLAALIGLVLWLTGTAYYYIT
jgi:hypothetical protein